MRLEHIKLKQWAQILVASGSMVILAACSSMHKNTDQAAVDDSNASYSDAQGASTAGAGNEDKFNDGDQASKASASQLSKRVYYFDFDSNVVHSSDMPAINANANYLLAHSKAKIMLEGHTDPRGSREYNIGLGERRAKAVAAVMTAKGVSRAQIRVVSYGAEKLAAQGHSEADYQLDRRVVLVYLQR